MYMCACTTFFVYCTGSIIGGSIGGIILIIAMLVTVVTLYIITKKIKSTAPGWPLLVKVYLLTCTL